MTQWRSYTLYFNKCSNIFRWETWTDNKVDVKIHMHSLTVFLLTMIINSKSRLKRTMVYVPVCMDSSNASFPHSKTLYAMVYIKVTIPKSQCLLVTVPHARCCGCEPEKPLCSRHKQFPITFPEALQNFSINNQNIFKLKTHTHTNKKPRNFQ